MPARRFPLVDALRALAALAVVGTHTAYFAGAYATDTALGPYAQRLDVGVTIFFLISGFLLYRPFVAARLEGRALDMGIYAWRRVLRIAPAYWVALTAALLLVASAGGWTWSATPSLFAFGQAYRGETLGVGLVQGWSLCVELAFYLFLPLWAAVLRRIGGRGLRTEWLGLVVLVGVSVAWKVTVVATTGSTEQVTIGPLLFALPTFLDQFAVGMALAVVSVQLGTRPAPAWLDRGAWVSWVLAGVAFWALSTRIGIGGRIFEPWTPAQYLERHALNLLTGALLVWPAVLGSGGRVRAFLAVPALRWIGVISYGVFLWNTIVLDVLGQLGFRPVLGVHPYVAWSLATLALTIAIAAASWYGLERPLQRLGHRRRAKAVPVSPARAAAG